MEETQPLEKVSCGWLLATDMDGTVIPLDDRPESLVTVQAFRDAVIGREDFLLAYITGRHLELALEGVEEAGLPIPDYVSGDVGTSLYRRTGECWQRMAGYDARMSAALGDTSLDEVTRDLEQALEGVTRQEDVKQGPFKGSLYLEARADQAGLVDAIKEHVQRRGVPAGVIYSRDEVSGRGLVDLLPGGVSKHSALEYLKESLGLPTEQVVYAGDSGNDEEVFRRGWQSVLVGNAAPDLKAEMKDLKAHYSLPIYVASGRYAEGVLEGWVHFKDRDTSKPSC